MPKHGDMIITITRHGDNIASQIHEDAYGHSGPLNMADLYAICDAMHTNFMDSNNEAGMKLMSEIMDRLIKEYSIQI